MNLFELFVKIVVDDQASGKLKDISSKLGNGLKTAGKIGVAAVGAAAAGITALTTAAVNNYAEYEQLVGGAELMFGKAYETVAKNAQDAYKTVQMSQNEYLQQVNGFATGLKTALGGNEQAAADLAHKIVQAEADIVAATGNTQENVANAFNGIMKSNFTMLDNLQIGITPTKEGFQEVIDKVNEWNKTNGEATNYQMGNLADMQSALVDYIDMVGMSGYAQMEASNTITGSISSMKSAWKNLLTGLADGNSDLKTLVDNLVTTIVGDGTENNPGVLGNIFPAVKAAIGGVSRLISELLPRIAKEVPSIIQENLPVINKAAIDIIESLITGIEGNKDVLLGSFLDAIIGAVSSVVNMLPYLFSVATTLVMTLAQAIAKAAPELIPAVFTAIQQIVTTLTDPSFLPEFVMAALSIIESLAWGINECLPVITKSTTLIVESILTTLLNPEVLSTLIAVAVQLVFAIASGILNTIPEAVRAAGRLVKNLYLVFAEADWEAVGSNVVSGFKKGISKAWGSLKKWFGALFGDLIGIAKKILGIASPSKVFKSLGGFTAEGFGIGFEDEFAHVKDDMEDALNFDDASVGINASIRKVGAGVAGGAFGGTSIGNININIDGTKYSDEQSLASAIALEIQNMTDRRAAVYA